MFSTGLRGQLACWGPRCPSVWLLQGISADLSSDGNVWGLVGLVVSAGLPRRACHAPGKLCVGTVALTLRLWLLSCPGFVIYN